MKYRIGQISKLLGLSAEGIRMYERDGILKSHREGTGGYRYYERSDIVSLILAKDYRGYGFSVSEAESLINTDDLDFVKKSFARRGAELRKEILHKRQILTCLHEREALLKKETRRLGLVRLAERPAFYLLEYMLDDELILRPEQYETFRRWIAMTPFVFPSLRCDWTALSRGEKTFTAALGLMERDIKRLGAEELAAAGRYYPPAPCLCTVVRAVGHRSSGDDYFAHLRGYVMKKALRVAGDPVSRTILSMNRQAENIRYRQIWLPVRAAA